jgi:YHS domain-containing protein
MKFLALSALLLFSLAGCRGAETRGSDPVPATRGRPVKDPVCGKTIDSRAARRIEHYGTTYFLCSDECLARFHHAPEAYMVCR